VSCPDGFWCFQLKDAINTIVLVATIVAIYLGPIRAVKISRDNDKLREAHRRKFSIFSNLMKTRRMILDPLHVSSLNIVEVEFHGHADIIRAYRAYLDYLNKPIQLNPSSPEADNFFRERDDLLFDLIHAIGGQLGYSYDKRDLRKFSYAPQGWQNVETEQQTFRRLIIELLSGRRPLPIKDFIASDVNDKFPPPPN
jgi:hypothetical protein